MSTRQTGAALLVGMVLLSLVTLLGLAAASGAHVERQLARNEQFRENAASVASAGIEIAISRIVSAPTAANVAMEFSASLPGTTDRFDVRTRLLGHEQGLPQLPEAQLAGAHIEILSTGHSLRGAVDYQRAVVMQVVEFPGAERSDCEPLAGGACLNAGELYRLSWQRMAPP